jgi:elongation factor 1-gamma
VAESGPNSQQLLGTTPLQRALIRQWISFAPDNVFTPVHDLIMWRVGYGTYEEKQEAKAMETLEKTLDILEATLSGEAKSKSGWLVECPEGKLSLADLSVASYLMFGFQFYIDKEIRSKYPETTEWYLRVVTDPSVGDAFAEVPTKPKMCEQRKIGGA